MAGMPTSEGMQCKYYGKGNYLVLEILSCGDVHSSNPTIVKTTVIILSTVSSLLSVVSSLQSVVSGQCHISHNTLTSQIDAKISIVICRSSILMCVTHLSL